LLHKVVGIGDKTDAKDGTNAVEEHTVDGDSKTEGEGEEKEGFGFLLK